MTVNKSYSKEFKEKILKSLQPPENKTVAQVALNPTKEMDEILLKKMRQLS